MPVGSVSSSVIAGAYMAHAEGAERRGDAQVAQVAQEAAVAGGPAIAQEEQGPIRAVQLTQGTLVDTYL